MTKKIMIDILGKRKRTKPFLMHDINSNPPRALAFTGEILLYVALCSIFYFIAFMFLKSL
jgi:hypothetical protein